MLLCVALWNAGKVSAATPPGSKAEMEYASPLELLFSPDGARIYVLCQESDEVRVLDAATYAPIGAVPVGHVPRGIALSAKGDRLFVANSWDDYAFGHRHTHSGSCGHLGGGRGAIRCSGGLLPASYLFVANRISNDVAVLNAQTGAEEKRLLAGRGASYLTLSPDGKRIYVTHVYPNPSPLRTGLENRTPPESEITVIDAGRAEVVDRIPLHSDCRRLSPGLFCRRTPWRGSRISPEKPCAAGASGARRSFRLHADIIRRGCRQTS